MTDQPRITPGSFRELGVFNWAFSRLAGKVTGTQPPNIFTTLGRQKGLFRGWLHFSGKLMPGGKLARRESELVILRVAGLRECAYEQSHHVRLGRKAGLTQEQIDHIDEGSSWSGWSDRDRLLLDVATSLVRTQDVDDALWQRMREELTEPECIELLMLVGQYDSLATTLLTLRVQPDE
ncbi:MAG TPA: carboxymuconolactone decarboxylase family protein [Aeromicrobium sp.]|nr:carboxymuconolactone decarboxylase family protein [Aeromicrobium sp.]